MLANIPTHLIAGPLGAGKTSLLQQLLAQRPEDERWGILINEFGLIGIDAALIGNRQGVSLTEIPGGCLCCVNGVPFQVGLTKLLRHARPDRLFIEASGLGHPVTLLEQLAKAPWQHVLALQPMIMVLDGQALAAGQPLPAAQAEALKEAGLLLINKSAELTPAERKALTQRFPSLALQFTERGALELAALPANETSHHLPDKTPAQLPDAPASPRILLRGPHDWLCSQQEHSIGWQLHAAVRFRQASLQHWLEQNTWQRAKGIVHTDQGWLSFNALEGASVDWQPSAWRRDNRIELLLTKPDRQALEYGLRDALVDKPANNMDQGK